MEGAGGRPIADNAPLAALASRQQPGAAAAALRRYGVEPDVFAIAAKRLAEMASAAAAATRRAGPVAVLPYDPRRAMEARRGSDAVPGVIGTSTPDVQLTKAPLSLYIGTVARVTPTEV